MTQVASSQALAPDVPAHGIPFGEALRVWARIAALSFGGPAGQIALMHRILVEEKRWIGENRFLHALNYCMLLPGPEAQQLAVYIGWLLHKTKGGLVAGTLFVLPGLLAIMALSWLYAAFGKVGLVAALFFGLKAAVLAIVLEAVLRIGRRALRNGVMVALAAAAFVAIFVLDVPFPLIILGAALIGWLGGRAGLAAFRPGGGHGKIGRQPGRRRRQRARRALAGARAAAARVVAQGRRDVSVALADADRAARAEPRRGPRVQRDRGLLLADGGGHLRRRLCGARLRRAGGGRHLRLARAGRDAGRARHGRDHAGAA